jgi:hypothetical protein
VDNFHHHHKHPGLGHLARSVSRVTVALSIVFSVSQLFSFLVGCSKIILKGFGFVAFFAGIRGLLEKYPTFGREKETGLLGALDT